jgi:uncharacterized Tic20 family protein
MQTQVVISSEERGLAVVTHLSGLAGYLVPFGGVLAPIIIWVVKKDSPVISAIAKQALLLNVIVFVVFCALAVLWITIILIPVVILAWILLGIVAVVLPIVGAVKASDGSYYRYPVVGIDPR